MLNENNFIGRKDMTQELSTEVKGREVAAGILPKLFNDINFNDLNKAIEVISEHSGKLDDEQRKSALDIVDEWNRSVVNRLKNHEEEISVFVQFLTSKSRDFRGYHTDPVARFGETKLQALAQSTGTSELLTKYLEARDHYDEISENSPEVVDYSEDPDLTLAELELKKIDAVREKREHTIKCQRARNAETNALRAWIVELNKNEGIREMVAKGKRYHNQVTTFSEECKMKAQSAKLSLTIPDADIRQAIKELIDFSSKI